MNKMILVTGAKGFLGRNISLFFYNKGYNVIGMGHGEWLKEEYSSWGLSSWINCEITYENLEKYGGNPKIIVHCAGSGSVADSFSNPMNDFTRSAVSLMAVLEFIRVISKDAKLIYPSSAAVYGKTTNKSISESDLVSPSSPYGTHKLICEELCKSYSKNFGCSVSVIRFYSLYGPGLTKQLLWDACIKLSKHNFNFYGTGKETRDWLHVKDAAELIYKVAITTTPKLLIINGSTNIGTSVVEILNKLIANMKLDVQPNFTLTERLGDPPYFIGDNSLAMNIFRWKPIYSIDDGLFEYYVWFKSLKYD